MKFVVVGKYDDLEAIKEEVQVLIDSGHEMIAPKSFNPFYKGAFNFQYFEGDDINKIPNEIEEEFLRKIDECDFVWMLKETGGVSNFELGYAYSRGIPIISLHTHKEFVLSKFFEVAKFKKSFEVAL